MKITKYFMMASASLLLASCLDTEPSGNLVTTDEKQETVENDPSRLEASVNAVTTNFSVMGNVRGEDVHSDIGYPSIMLLLDSRGVDMVEENTGYNWFSFALTYDDIDYTYGDNRMIWCTLYNQIYAANNVVATVGMEPTDAVSQGYLAQALAIRAFDYFQLVQCYQQTYANVDPNTALGVPVITEANKEEVAKDGGCPRATVAKTYEQILSDLNAAIDLLQKSNYKRTDKRYVDLYTARAIRARVYLVMHNYEKALEDANFVIENSGAKPLSIAEASQPGFADINANNWLWGIKISETDRVVTTGISNFPSHMGSLNYGYATVGAWKRINKKLYEKNINETDARKGWFLDENGVSKNLTAEQQEYVTGKKAPAYTQVKFAPYKGVVGTSTNASDIPLIRIEEMYMIKAECEAQTNATKGASTLKDFIRQYRDPSYNLNASTTEGVVNAILTQRRIEFYGEGITWFDFIRLNKDFDRRGAGYDATEVYNIPAKDDCLIWRVPKNEMQHNKFITEEQNNPVGKHPTAVADE